MIVLALETSCDETAAAILCDERGLLASEVASQIAIHQAYGGVVPEVASRQHLTQLRPVVEAALNHAGLCMGEIDAVAATAGPGLATSLMIGLSAAKGLALGLKKPFVAINHMEGHLLSPFFPSPCVLASTGLVVSGGHTLLVDVEGFGCYSFSGLKTAVRYLIPKLPDRSEATLADVCASFQEAVVDVLVAKTLAAVRATGRKTVAMSGGVSCNSRLRAKMSQACEAAGIELLVADAALCTDNAAMIGFVALHKLRQNTYSPLTTDIDPNLRLV